jgi:hypothetical protein
MAEVGEVSYYLNHLRGFPLVITDDDISGTFTFVRALPDHGNRRDLTAQEIGQTWLNYIIERRSILWWGGLGNSTEHTAYLRLKRGIPAPQSGSIALNTKTVAEQIGAQIFIDGWAMVAPGDPELAVYLARQAASVSHDGEAIYGAQVIAAMESLAYVEIDLNRLIDAAVTFIPPDSIIRRLIDNVREWRREFPDWRDTRLKIEENYGYDKYAGNCHIVPNHALIHLALLYGDDDFQKSLMIVNTSGWDTDCNSGNVGCLLGIKNGLAGIEAGPDWRSPVADRLYLPTADGGSAITDAVAQTDRIVNVGRALAGQPPLAPKGGSRFHFEMPGSVQAFMPDSSVESKGVVRLENVEGYSALGTRSLAIRYRHLARGRSARAATRTFIPPEDINLISYDLHASPTLYPGQSVHLGFMADGRNVKPVTCCPYIQIYGVDDTLTTILGPQTRLAPGEAAVTDWRIADTGGAPIATVGVQIDAVEGRADGTVYLDYLTWDGEPNAVFARPDSDGTMWRRAWIPGVDSSFDIYWPETYRILHNEGTGLLIQGTHEWSNYTVRATVVPHMVKAFGIAARVQGMRRFYALLITDQGQARLVKMLNDETILGETDFPWEQENDYAFELEASGPRLVGHINGRVLFDVEDREAPLESGAAAFLCTEGCMSSNSLSVSPSQRDERY